MKGVAIVAAMVVAIGVSVVWLNTEKPAETVNSPPVVNPK